MRRTCLHVLHIQTARGCACAKLVKASVAKTSLLVFITEPPNIALAQKLVKARVAKNMLACFSWPSCQFRACANVVKASVAKTIFSSSSWSIRGRIQLFFSETVTFKKCWDYVFDIVLHSSASKWKYTSVFSLSNLDCVSRETLQKQKPLAVCREGNPF